MALTTRALLPSTHFSGGGNVTVHYTLQCRHILHVKWTTHLFFVEMSIVCADICLQKQCVEPQKYTSGVGTFPHSPG